MKKRLLFILLLSLTSFCFAQERFWKFENEQSVITRANTRLNTPQVYRTVSLSFEVYKSFLNNAPAESVSGFNTGLEISLPYPDNSFKKFIITETRIMEEALAQQFPQIKTYYGQGLDDPASSVRIDYTTLGFHAMVSSPAGSLFIDPFHKENSNLYLTYFSKDYVNIDKDKFNCKVNDLVAPDESSPLINTPLAVNCIGSQLRTYRAAISCTGEYAVEVCPPGNVTVANTLSAIITTMNRVNGVYQTELAIKMLLVAANASIIYTDPDTDPFTGNDNPDTLINQSQATITSVIGSSAFDIGHTFSTGGSGLAYNGVVCNNANKARGISGLYSPQGEPFDIDYVAHEIGHQFGASHSFEGIKSSCQTHRSKTSAYEPGSGTTIMGYSGICGTDNIQRNSDPYFHSRSFDQIVAYTTTGNGSTCAVLSPTGNTPPVVVMPVSDIKIPKGTPFTLTGSATDVNGDTLTYSWEEWDSTNSNTGSEWYSGANSTVAPLFKTRIPKTSASRTFPDMSVILASYPSQPSASRGGLKGEILPQVARDIKFRLIARDNRAGGGGIAIGGNGCSSGAGFKVVVTDDGPFKVKSPNTAVNWLGGSTRSILWDVANTASPVGINAKYVDILMSIDGGNTYPTIIEANTPNDGSRTITIPNIPTNNSVRFMVKASGNIFFDISDVNFTITYNSVLPVSLLHFSVGPNGNAILISWSTATESNNKVFEILRSAGSDNNFVKIGAIAGAGNSSSVQNYSFNDISVKKGVVYFYRIRQIDFNNAEVYSDIKRAKVEQDDIFSAGIRPQPFYSNADLYLAGIDKKNFNIIIMDVMGRILVKKEYINNERSRILPIDLNKQAPGIYFVKFIQNNFETTIKAVKR